MLFVHSRELPVKIDEEYRLETGEIIYMAKESFDKEIQFLRMLVLTSGAYNRQQYADRLGISVHTFDKTMKRLKEIVSTVNQQLPEDKGKEFADTIRYSYLDSSDPMLLFLFRAKSLKESESQRLSLLLAALHDQPLTAMELLDLCCSSMPAGLPLPDEKTIRNDLKYLEQVGVIKKNQALALTATGFIMIWFSGFQMKSCSTYMIS